MQNGAATRWLLITSAGLVFALFGFGRSARAADLLSVADYLNRQQADITSGISHHLFFTPATTLPVAGNTVRIEFPTSPVGTWCSVAGVDLSVSGVSDPPGASEGATPLPGTLSGGCTIGNGTTTFDTITVTNVGALNAGTKYGYVITDPGIAKLGTPPPANSITEIMTTNNGVVDIDSLLYYANTLLSDRVTVSATVVATPPSNPNPSIEFIGLTAPSGSITVTRNGTSISTVPIGTDGTFDLLFTDQPIGQNVYVLSALDRDNLALPPSTYAVSMASNSSTVINGIFLGPTITISPTSVTVGQNVTAAGNTAPNSSLTLTIDGSSQHTFTALADAAGRWSKIMNSSDIGVGSHTIRARAFLGGSTQSDLSAIVSLTVLAATVTPTLPPTTPPSTPPTTPPFTPNACDGKVKADLNCDGKVNLIDFSIILFFWQQPAPKNRLADINGDGRVDIIDFSIILSMWTL